MSIIMQLKPLYLAMILLPCSHISVAQSNIKELPTLETIEVTASEQNLNSLPFNESRKASDIVIKKEQLRRKSATLGNALAGERGIHSNPFGGGASAPIIRGQEGVRIKILQNGTDVVDMSSVSPDHAVATDSLLSEQIELVRGSATLLYATASQAGVINVIDKRIPTQIPDQGQETEFFGRYNFNNQEKLATIGSTIGVGKNIAVRVEGLARHSENYAVPSLMINPNESPVTRLPDSYNRSNVGTLGVSWIDHWGYIGTSFSQRQDKYGLVGHNHMFDHCAPHILSSDSPSYLMAYPHLMQDKDVSKGLHDMHCGNNHADNTTHHHSNIYGHQHDHSGHGPWVDLISKRYDIRGELLQPFKGIEKIRLSSTYSQYYHDERGDGKVFLDEDEKKQIERGYISSNVKKRLQNAEFLKNNPESVYHNKGWNTRLDIIHQPIGDIDKWGELKGSWGVQYQTQKSSVKRPYHITENGYIYGERQTTGREPLVDNTNKQLSFFGVEQYRIRNFTFEAGIRSEHQQTPIHYQMERFEPYFKQSTQRPDLSPYKEHALSYSAGILWDFKPNYRLSFISSHNERIPTPMELYYHGKHLATNSYQYGNRDLDKEQSNNFELGFMYQGDVWNYKLSTYYNHFKNYIHNESLYREGNLFQRRYAQSQANIYGIEGEISYRFTPQQQVTLYGDLVHGRLSKLPKIYGDSIYREYECIDEFGDLDTCYEKIGVETIDRPKRNAPRMPPARLGVTWISQWNDNWSSNFDIMRVFDQNRTSTAIWVKEKANDDETKVEGAKLNTYPIYEDATKGYTMLNIGIDYQRTFGKVDYKLSLNANNLLNEKVYIHNSYLPYVPQMGRNFSLGMQLKF